MAGLVNYSGKGIMYLYRKIKIFVEIVPMSAAEYLIPNTLYP